MAGRILTLKHGAVTYGADGLIFQASNGTYPTLLQHVGRVFFEGSVSTLLTGDTAVTKRPVRVNLGCIVQEWAIKQALEAQSVPKSCTTSTFNYATSANWTVTLNSREINPVFLAAVTGGTVENTGAAAPFTALRLMKTETLTSSASAVLTLSSTPVAVLSVKRVSDGALFYEAASTPTGLEYTLATTAMTCENVAANQSTAFEVVYDYSSTTASHGLVQKFAGTNFPTNLSKVRLGYLVLDRENNTTGQLIVEATNLSRSGGDVGIGGAAQDMGSITVDFAVNGETTFFWQEFA